MCNNKCHNQSFSTVFANVTLDSINEITRHTAFNSIIILIMLLDVTLEYMKFGNTPILLQLSPIRLLLLNFTLEPLKARCNCFCQCHPEARCQGLF